MQVRRPPPLVPGAAVSGVRGQEGPSGGGGADVAKKALHWLERMSE